MSDENLASLELDLSLFSEVYLVSFLGWPPVCYLKATLSGWGPP